MQRGPDCLSGSNATQNASASTRSPVPGSDKPPYAATIFNHNGARPAPLGCLDVSEIFTLSQLVFQQASNPQLFFLMARKLRVTA
jgi:hypothetical protein